MPVFNNPDLTVRMISSICSSTFQDWELLAIDDGSNPEAKRIIGDFCKKDSRIIYVDRNEAPKGAQTCRNRGLIMAQGEFIIFFDSDDLITERCLERRVKALQEHADADFLVFPSGVIEKDVFDKGVRKFVFGYKAFDDDIESFCRRLLPFIVWNNIYRTESVRRHSLKWDTHLRSLQDADFNLCAIISGLKYEYIQTEPDYGYRIDANSGSVSKKVLSAEHKESHLYAISKFYDTIQQKFGHKYDSALFHGVLFLYNLIFTDKVDYVFANAIADKIAGYDAHHSRQLKFIIRITRLLNHILPDKKARQLPMFFHLKDYYRRESMKLKRINMLRNNQL